MAGAAAAAARRRRSRTPRSLPRTTSQEHTHLCILMQSGAGRPANLCGGERAGAGGASVGVRGEARLPAVEGIGPPRRRRGEPRCAVRSATDCSMPGSTGCRWTWPTTTRPAVEPPSAPPPDDPGPVALVSVWLDCHDDRGPVESILSGHADRLAGYLVTESIPTDYGDNRWATARDWPDGARSPGVVMLTLMEKPDRMTDGQWYDHWYGTQTPMSTAIQPRIRYVRNAVRSTADRRSARPTAASSRRPGRRSSTSTTRCSSTAPTATRRSWPPT